LCVRVPYDFQIAVVAKLLPGFLNFGNKPHKDKNPAAQVVYITIDMI